MNVRLSNQYINNPTEYQENMIPVLVKHKIAILGKQMTKKLKTQVWPGNGITSSCQKL